MYEHEVCRLLAKVVGSFPTTKNKKSPIQLNGNPNLGERASVKLAVAGLESWITDADGMAHWNEAHIEIYPITLSTGTGYTYMVSTTVGFILFG